MMTQSIDTTCDVNMSLKGGVIHELFESLGTDMDQPVEREWELKIPGVCDLMLLFLRIIGDEH